MPAADAAFRESAADRGLVVLVHSAYLVNLASPTAMTYERSVTSVAHALARGLAVGAVGVVVHTGSYVTEGGRDAAMRHACIVTCQAGALPIGRTSSGMFSGLPPGPSGSRMAGRLVMSSRG